MCMTNSHSCRSIITINHYVNSTQQQNYRLDFLVCDSFPQHFCPTWPEHSISVLIICCWCAAVTKPHRSGGHTHTHADRLPLTLRVKHWESVDTHTQSHTHWADTTCDVSPRRLEQRTDEVSQSEATAASLLKCLSGGIKSCALATLSPREDPGCVL